MLQQFVRSLLNIVSQRSTPSVSPLQNSAQITGVSAPAVGVLPTNQPAATKPTQSPKEVFK